MNRVLSSNQRKNFFGFFPGFLASVVSFRYYEAMNNDTAATIPAHDIAVSFHDGNVIAVTIEAWSWRLSCDVRVTFARYPRNGLAEVDVEFWHSEDGWISEDRAPDSALDDAVDAAVFAAEACDWYGRQDAATFVQGF